MPEKMDPRTVDALAVAMKAAGCNCLGARAIASAALRALVADGWILVPKEAKSGDIHV